MAESPKTVQLSTEFQQQAEAWVRAGQFRSVQDAAIAAFSLLQHHEERRVELRSQMDDAVSRCERGELEELDDEEFSVWLDNQ